MKVRWFLFIAQLFLCLLVSGQAATLNMDAVQNQPVKNLTSDEISKLTNVTDGTTVFNTTTGCINYFFGGLWNESCGNCIPKYHKPVIKQMLQSARGIEIVLADTFRYQAVLLPDSETTVSLAGRMLITKPAKAVEEKKYRLVITNLSDPCHRRPATDTTVFFTADMASGKTGNTAYHFPTVVAGTRVWMSEPASSYVNDEKVAVKINRNVYYNWTSLNKDSFAPAQKNLYYSKNVCPTGFEIPSVQDAEELVRFNTQQNVFKQFKVGEYGLVLNFIERKEEPTDDRFVFMLKETEHPDGFQVLLLTPNDFRIAQLPRAAYVRILCVSAD